MHAEVDDSYRIRERARRKYGDEIPTIWSVINHVKTLSQKYKVDQYISFVNCPGKSLRINVDNRVAKTLDLVGTSDRFFHDIFLTIEEMGYRFSAGDGFFEVSKA